MRAKINKKDSAACIFKEPPIFIDPKVIVNSNPYKKNDLYHQKFPDLTKRNKTSEIEYDYMVIETAEIEYIEIQDQVKIWRPNS